MIKKNATSFYAKVIIETDRYAELYDKKEGDLLDISFARIKEIIREGKIEVRMVDDFLSWRNEPVIIITDLIQSKNGEKKN